MWPNSVAVIQKPFGELSFDTPYGINSGTGNVITLFITEPGKSKVPPGWFHFWLLVSFYDFPRHFPKISKKSFFSPRPQKGPKIVQNGEYSCMTTLLCIAVGYKMSACYTTSGVDARALANSPERVWLSLAGAVLLGVCAWLGASSAHPPHIYRAVSRPATSTTVARYAWNHNQRSPLRLLAKPPMLVETAVPHAATTVLPSQVRFYSIGCLPSHHNRRAHPCLGLQHWQPRWAFSWVSWVRGGTHK